MVELVRGSVFIKRGGVALGGDRNRYVKVKGPK